LELLPGKLAQGVSNLVLADEQAVIQIARHGD
jgi:hypothetical protein